jgi:hypothetical protein
MKRFIFYTTVISIIFYLYNKKQERKEEMTSSPTTKTRVIKANKADLKYKTKKISKRKYNPDESDESKALKKQLPYNLNNFVTKEVKRNRWQRVLTPGEISELTKLNDKKLKNENFGSEEEFLMEKLRKKDIFRAILYRKTTLVKKDNIQKSIVNNQREENRDDYEDPYEKLLREREEEERKREAQLQKEIDYQEPQEYKDNYQEPYVDDYPKEEPPKESYPEENYPDPYVQDAIENPDTGYQDGYDNQYNDEY